MSRFDRKMQRAVRRSSGRHRRVVSVEEVERIADRGELVGGSLIFDTALLEAPDAPVGASTISVHDPEARTLFVLLNPEYVADTSVQAALALRNRATLEGKCPTCGAREGSPVHSLAVMVHEDACPAGDQNVLALVRGAEA